MLKFSCSFLFAQFSKRIFTLFLSLSLFRSLAAETYLCHSSDSTF
jgi:hypothetical protein